MNEADIQKAIGQRLAATSGLPAIVWPNKDASLPALPYVVVDFVPGTRTDSTLGGTAMEANGFVMVTVVSELDAFATDGLAQAQTIADRFPKALRLLITGATVLITKPSEVKQGYRDGPHWRTPVRIDYRAS